MRQIVILHSTQTDTLMFLLSFFLSCLWPLPQQKANHDDFYLYTYICTFLKYSRQVKDGMNYIYYTFLLYILKN